MKKPVISVIVTTYNQEKYIAECLESILVQRDCPEFEIIIGNDCSSDNTDTILKKFQAAHPNIIHLLPRSHNLGMLQNLKDCFNYAQGDYITICEGDDYWKDSHNLKKRYEALSGDSDALLCFNNITLAVMNKRGNVKFLPHIKSVKNKIRTHLNIQQLILFGNPIGNFSCCMYKKQALNYIPDSFYEGKGNADFLFNLYVLHNSFYAIYINEEMSVYRILPNGQWSGQTPEQQQDILWKGLHKYDQIFNYKYHKEFFGMFMQTIRAQFKYKKWGISIPLTHNKRFFIGIIKKRKK